MGDATPRQQPPSAQGAGEDWEETDAEQEPQGEPGPPPADDLAKDKDPQSKFHG